MLTQQEISRKAAKEYRNRTAEEEYAFAYGATWASAQYATEIARLEGEKAEILDALRALFDEQNDAPLERRRAQWEQAYKTAGVILKKYGR